jgi:putative ABC transport system ATP-binding protein
MPVLEAEDLSRSYGEGSTRVTVLRSVSLCADRGEFVLLMGPSGSGKSTLLSVLSGLARPDTGRVRLFGQDVWSLSDAGRERLRRRHCGFVFQGYNLFPALTAREQLEMVLRWGEGLSAREAGRRVTEALDLLGLGDKGGLFPSQLSGGEKQRLATGRALLKRPDVCFADEPTAALDWANGSQVVELLRDRARRDNTLMFVVAHDSRLIPYADRLFYLDDGGFTAAPPATPALTSLP